MAVEPDSSTSGADADVDVDDELSHGQAEAVLARTLDLREEVDAILSDIEADVRKDPASIPDHRVDELAEATGDLGRFFADLRDLEPQGRGTDD